MSSADPSSPSDGVVTVNGGNTVNARFPDFLRAKHNLPPQRLVKDLPFRRPEGEASFYGVYKRRNPNDSDDDVMTGQEILKHREFVRKENPGIGESRVDDTPLSDDGMAALQKDLLKEFCGEEDEEAGDTEMSDDAVSHASGDEVRDAETSDSAGSDALPQASSSPANRPFNVYAKNECMAKIYEAAASLKISNEWDLANYRSITENAIKIRDFVDSALKIAQGNDFAKDVIHHLVCRQLPYPQTFSNFEFLELFASVHKFITNPLSHMSIEHIVERCLSIVDKRFKKAGIPHSAIRAFIVKSHIVMNEDILLSKAGKLAISEADLKGLYGKLCFAFMTDHLCEQMKGGDIPAMWIPSGNRQKAISELLRPFLRHVTPRELITSRSYIFATITAPLLFACMTSGDNTEEFVKEFLPMIGAEHENELRKAYATFVALCVAGKSTAGSDDFAMLDAWGMYRDIGIIDNPTFIEQKGVVGAKGVCGVYGMIQAIVTTIGSEGTTSAAGDPAVNKITSSLENLSPFTAGGSGATTAVDNITSSFGNLSPFLADGSGATNRAEATGATGKTTESGGGNVGVDGGFDFVGGGGGSGFQFAAGATGSTDVAEMVEATIDATVGAGGGNDGGVGVFGGFAGVDFVGGEGGLGAVGSVAGVPSVGKRAVSGNRRKLAGKPLLRRWES